MHTKTVLMIGRTIMWPALTITSLIINTFGWIAYGVIYLLSGGTVLYVNEHIHESTVPTIDYTDIE